MRIKLKCVDLPVPTIFFTNFLNALGFGILIPVIPLLLADPSSQYFMLPQGLTLYQGYIIFGFLVAIYPLMQFLATPILGQLSDKFGRKKILGISIAGTLISFVLFAIGILLKNLPMLFIARAFDGITGGNISVAQAVIADVTTPQNRSKTFGLIGASFGLGFIIGPFLGGILSESRLVPWFNAATPFWFAAILNCVNLVLVIICLAETFKVDREKKIVWSQALRNIATAFGVRELRTIFITVFLFQSGFTFFTTFFSVFLLTKFGFTQSNTGNFFASSNGLTQANITGLLSRSVGPEIQGQVLGINASVQALGQAIPAMLSGFIAAGLTPSAPSVVAASIIIFAGILFLVSYRKPAANAL